ncbi:hypothetical protein FJD36_15150 [Pseudomonas chlororaphis subsp. chlororaphis]|nr:hypothetical protein FJD36_15150 [Pseudomonas chlororaphis subsp. chlororaphis]
MAFSRKLRPLSGQAQRPPCPTKKRRTDAIPVAAAAGCDRPERPRRFHKRRRSSTRFVQNPGLPAPGPALIVRRSPRWRFGFGDLTVENAQADGFFAAVRSSAESRYGGCARETSGSAGFLYCRFANLRTAVTLSFGDD